MAIIPNGIDYEHFFLALNDLPRQKTSAHTLPLSAAFVPIKDRQNLLSAPANILEIHAAGYFPCISWVE